MWVAIGILAGVVFTDTFLIWVLMWRLRTLEDFMGILSGVVIGQATNEALAQYLKSRTDHPAGKKIRRHDGGHNHSGTGAQPRGSETEERHEG